MMIPHQHELVRVDREFKHRLHIEGLGKVFVEIYFDEIGLGTYVILIILEPMGNFSPIPKFKEIIPWDIISNRARSKFGVGTRIILKVPSGKVHPLIYCL